MDVSAIQIWSILGGLGLFMFGMTMLENAVKGLGGRSFKLFLQKHTGNVFKAVLSGTLITAIMQSSSLVILLVMSFTAADIIGLRSGIALILGANVGTTITGWMVALIGFKLNIENFYLPAISLGAIGQLFWPNGNISQVFRLLFGFGLMFLGLSFMKDGFTDFTQKVDLSIISGKPFFLFVLFGFILAATIRSSSAAIMIFLTSLAAGSINLHQAGYLAIGADLGTTITGLLGTIHGNSLRKKTGWSHFYINLITAVVALLLIDVIFDAIYFAGIHDKLFALVSFHTIFNVLGIIVILPFLTKFIHFIDTYISTDDELLTKYLSKSDNHNALSFKHALTNETERYLLESLNIQHLFFISTNSDSIPEEAYNKLKKYENEIFGFTDTNLLNRKTGKEPENIQNLLSSLRYSTISVKGIKDISHNLDECRQSVNNKIFELYTLLIENENEFYGSYDKILKDKNQNTAQILKLRTDNEKKYEDCKESAFLAYNENQNFDLASVLNMIREIRDSRELLLKAYEQWNKTLD